MKEKIDELFKESLKEPEIPFEEMHWLSMKKKLDQKQNKRRVVAWLASIGSVAALLLIAFTWWNLTTDDNSSDLK